MVNDPLIIDEKKRKTCIACTQAKRKCDKGAPECERCMSKGVVCQYPDTPRYARLSRKRLQHNPVADDQLMNPIFSPDPIGTNPVEPESLSRQEGESWVGLGWPGLEQPQTDDLSMAVFTKEMPLFNQCWFSGPEAWAIDCSATHCYEALPPNHVSVLNLWIDEVREWLQQWLETRHNAFIHEQLYAYTGLPSCLQEAWSTLATYYLKTKRNEIITMSIVQSRVETMMAAQGVNGELSHEICGLRTIDHLARVQAMFIYQFIRLFDGDVRQRALAEQQFCVLHKWCEQLWESAMLESSTEGISWQVGMFDATDPKAKLWGNWVLGESVRRTWYLCKILHSIYFTLRDGWAECPGSIRFTARKDLWEATSPTAWAQLAQNMPLLLVSGLRDDQLFTSTKSSDVDPFSTLLLKLLWGPQRVTEWAKNDLKDRDAYDITQIS